MSKNIFSKEDLCLLLSALASYVEHSSLTSSLDSDKVYLYIRDFDFDRHVIFLNHCRDLSKRLIEILNNFD